MLHRFVSEGHVLHPGYHCVLDDTKNNYLTTELRKYQFTLAVRARFPPIRDRSAHLVKISFFISISSSSGRELNSINASLNNMVQFFLNALARDFGLVLSLLSGTLFSFEIEKKIIKN